MNDHNSSNSGRRARGNTIKHKYDKQLINAQGTVNANQHATTLITMTYPAVIMGVVISGSAISVNTTATNQSFVWALVIVEEGNNTNTLSATDGAAIYTPEQMVMAFGSGYTNTNSGIYFHVKTKTGRKVKAGDKLIFIGSSSSAVNTNYLFTIQFFTKI